LCDTNQFQDGLSLARDFYALFSVKLRARLNSHNCELLLTSFHDNWLWQKSKWQY